MARNEFNIVSFLFRLAFSFTLVFLTYNPSGYSWVDWLFSEVPLVYKVAGGILLLIGWVMYLRATWNSLGPIGTVLAAAFFGVIIWLLIEWNILSLNSAAVFQWVVLIILIGVLAVGMSWSHVRRRWSGQVDTDDIDEND